MPERDTDQLLALYAEFLQAGSAPMRRVAVWEIGRLGDPRGATCLMEAIESDPDWECRHYAIMSLANVGGPEEARRLRELACGDYLSADGRDLAGPLPAALRDHLLSDLELSARCCAGEMPRPNEAPDQHGDWWRGHAEP